MSANRKTETMSLIETVELINQCHAPQVKEGNDRPCCEKDFFFFTNVVLKKLNKLEETLLNYCDYLHSKEIVIPLLILIGENSKKQLWNTEEIWNSCQRLLTIVRTNLLIEGMNLGEADVHTELRQVLKPMLLMLRPKLLKETWKTNPAAVICYSWLLQIAKGRHIANQIQNILPTALLLVDDFENDNRIIGVKCLSRIVQELTIAELKFHGYGQLIYKELERLLREKDKSLAEILIPTILSLIGKLETNLDDANKSHEWSLYDDFLEIYLEVMHMEDVIALRSIYMSFIPEIINKLGCRINRWVKRIIAILDHYLEIAAEQKDFKTCSTALDAMRILILTNGKVRDWYRDEILFIVFRTGVLIKLKNLNESGCFEKLHLIMSLVQENASSEEKNKLKADLNLLCGICNK